MSAARTRPVVLAICDGWGVAPPGEGNPVEAAETPVFDELVRTFPTCTIRASGEAVGLSWGDMGNSEVGHLTIGAGKIFYQSLPRINMAIQTGTFFQNPALLEAAAHCKKNGSAFQIMGILSPGNVHGSNEHIYALMQFAKQQGLTDVVIHPVLDGRDTIYNTGIDFVRELSAKCLEIGVGRIGSLAGRYWTMDRDNRWDRVEKGYRAMTGGGQVKTAVDPVAAIQQSYDSKVYDEEFEPLAVVGKDGKPVGAIKDGDAVIFANFRPDRARQIAKVFVEPEFNKFERPATPNLMFCSMMEYEKGTKAMVVFPPELIDTCLAKVVSEAGLKQLHIAETEKYAHVTFFLNGMREEPYPNEDRVIVPSPRVSTYDQAPAMSTPKLAERIVKEVQDGKYDLIIVNFANADMVGHTGKYQATKEGCEAVDRALGQIVEVLLPRGGVLIMTADHGNGEEVMNLQTGEIDKEHSTNPVPLIIAAEQWRGQAAPSGEVVGGDLSIMPPVGMLADVTPTILKILGVPQPKSMTGCPMI